MPSREPIELPAGPIATRVDAPRVEVPDALIEALRSEVGPDRVQTGEDAMTPYGRDWWPLAVVWATQAQVPARPDVVVRADNEDHVVATVRRCAEAAVPLTTSAGRSGVCGGALPITGGVVLDVTGLDRIVDIDDTSLLLSVEAGVFGDVLEGHLQSEGYTLGHWPQSIEMSTVGGWLACRSAGQYSTRYGKIEDMVTGLRAVTGTGATLRTGGSPRAAVGPDLTQLIVGSEGTLAVVTEAQLRIHPRPAVERTVVYGFSGFADGLDACRRILRRGATPAVLRLYDQEESGRHFGELLGGRAVNVLIVIDEGDEAVVEATVRVVESECSGAERLDTSIAEHWRERRNDVSALPAVVKAGVVVDTVELAGSWSMLPRLYADACAALSAVEGSLVASAHCSHSYLDGGCLYFTFAGRPTEDTPAAKDAYYRASLAAIMEATLSLGGAISHHHGIGLARAEWMARALGGEGLRVLAGLKDVVDPAGILNPGKLGLASPFLPAGWTWT